MALSGPQALRSLDDAIRDIRREESDIGKRLSRSTERLAKIQETEAEMYRKLARVRLDPEVQSQIEGRLSRAENRARQVIKEHASQLGKAEKQIKQLDEAIAVLARKRSAALESVDDAQAKLFALSSKIASTVTKDPDYANLRARADELQAVANESLKKTRQAEADQETKGKPYREDPLFMYLWEAGYGTRNYKANNLVRWLDSKVARLVDYRNARANFSMLNEIPLRLREHADRQIALAEEAEEQLDALEDRAVEKAGGGPIKRALQKAQEELERIDLEMLEAEDKRDNLSEEFSALAEGGNPTFSKAVGELASALAGQDIKNLVAMARKSATRQDDAIVAKIDDARTRQKDEEDETRELNARLKVLAQRRRELEDIQWEFKKSRFDDPRSTFRKDELVGDLLSEFLKGAITASNYWGQWQRSQNWKAGTSDWGGGIGLPRSGRRSPWSGATKTQWPRASAPRNPVSRGRLPGLRAPRPSTPRAPTPRPGFTRPRSGSRGSRRSGGFKTGGGF
ncbi:MAG TPA: hypothetical protein ENJ90_04505 [Devosia sp.]|nr:hypothetical protein [Devosia sp.]